MSRILYPSPASIANVWIVDPVNGSDTGSGSTTATIGGAVGKASPGDRIIITPGSYAENVVIPKNKPGLTLECALRHGGDIAPDTGTPLTIAADSTTLVHLDLEAPDGETALIVTGDRCRAIRCKIEGGDFGLQLSPRTVAAGGHGGADCIFEDCEFCWSDVGAQVLGTDYGAATQDKFIDCIFHNHVTASINEAVGSGGSAPVTFRDLLLKGCIFGRQEDGTAPTDFLALNADNGNTGLISDCDFAFATNEADVITIGSGMLFVANRTEAGVTTGRPS